MKHPSKIAIVYGSLLSAATAASTQLSFLTTWGHHEVIFVLALAGALLIHPSKPATIAGEPMLTPIPTDGANRTPTSPV